MREPALGGSATLMTDAVVRSFILQCESRELDLSAPRTCHLASQVNVGERDDCWLAQVDPPFLGQHFGLGADLITDVVIATRLPGVSLFDEERIDVPIYVARILDPDGIAKRTLEPEQIELILWCYAKRVR